MAAQDSHDTGTSAGEAFSAEERERQRLDDQRAWRSITGILIFILGIGLLLGVVSIWLVSAIGY